MNEIKNFNNKSTKIKPEIANNEEAQALALDNIDKKMMLILEEAQKKYESEVNMKITSI